MKIKTLTLGLAALAAGLGTAAAQDAIETGRVLNANGPLFDAGLKMLAAGQDNIYGTARSAAMGGAFTSLGADLSSMTVNPAGLGMYQTSDWGFSTALSYDRMETRPSGGLFSGGGGKVSFGLNNLGAAWNIYNGSGTLTGVTFGIAYNRAANFNSRTRFDTRDEDSSIGQVFARQLNYWGHSEDALNRDPWNNLDIGLPQWGAVLGYQTGVVGLNKDGGYGTWNDANTSDTRFSSKTRGGIHEFAISGGVNLSNILYLGATLGLTDIVYVEHTSYEEIYNLSSRLSGMRFDQNVHMKGSGTSVKVGAIVRPVEWLRIGVAFHSPTYCTLGKKYDGFMEAGREWASTGELTLKELRFNSAPRLSAGISGVLGGRAIVAIDWEAAWYNKMREPEYVTESLYESERMYKPAHTVRAGLEYLLSDAVSLRAGGSWMGDFVRDEYLVANNPTTRSGFSLACGGGFKFGGGGYLDVAYVYNRARQTDYELFHFDDGHEWTGQADNRGGDYRPRTYTPTRHHHMLTITLGQRF